jgi:hypothetical protein
MVKSPVVIDCGRVGSPATSTKLVPTVVAVQAAKVPFPLPITAK